MSTPNIHSNFNHYAAHNNGGANVYNLILIPPITSDEEQNFNSAPTNPYNHNSRGTSTRVELSKDVGKVVRQGNLKFNGSSKASAEDFLTRVDECRIFSPLSDIELISALPLLVTGVALQWYPLKKPQWTSWSTFRTAFRSRFGENNFDRRVGDQIRAHSRRERENRRLSGLSIGSIREVGRSILGRRAVK